MDEMQKELARVIENYFGADAGYLDIDCFTLARRILEAGWEKPVRCKECVGWCPEEIAKKYGVDRYCTLTRIPTDADDFCSYGERRTDEKNLNAAY